MKSFSVFSLLYILIIVMDPMVQKTLNTGNNRVGELQQPDARVMTPQQPHLNSAGPLHTVSIARQKSAGPPHTVSVARQKSAGPPHTVEKTKMF